jgi:hypothetical protein
MNTPAHRIHIAFARSVGPYWGYVRSHTPVEIATVEGESMQEVRDALLLQLRAAGAAGQVIETHGFELA